MNFDHIVFSASTDCFSAKLLGGRFTGSLNGIKNMGALLPLNGRGDDMPSDLSKWISPQDIGLGGLLVRTLLATRVEQFI